MKKLLCALFILLLAGCATINGDYTSVPGPVDRALQKNIHLGGVDTGVPTEKGITVSDAGVVAYGEDLEKITNASLAYYNNRSMGTAMARAGLTAAMTGMAFGGAPIGAIGGVGIFTAGIESLFQVVDSPGKATAYQKFLERIREARTEYWTTLKFEGCADKVEASGTILTNAGITYYGRQNSALTNLDSALQYKEPTPAQILDATPDMATTRARMRLLAAPCVVTQLPNGEIKKRRILEGGQNVPQTSHSPGNPGGTVVFIPDK